MTLRELILKLQELDKKYEQYSQDTEVVLAIHSKNEFNPEVNLDYIDEVLHPALDTFSGYICRIVLCGESSKKTKRFEGRFSSLPFLYVRGDIIQYGKH